MEQRSLHCRLIRLFRHWSPKSFGHLVGLAHKIFEARRLNPYGQFNFEGDSQSRFTLVQQNLKFRAPVFLDEELTAAVVIQELKSEGRRVVLSTSVTKADGEAAISGFAIVKAPRESSVVEVEPLDA